MTFQSLYIQVRDLLLNLWANQAEAAGGFCRPRFTASNRAIGRFPYRSPNKTFQVTNGTD